MAAVGEVISDRSSASHLGSGELHVLAVDDSIVDRKVIERLLKIASCRVTAVESGTRALQYLGLDGNKSSVQFDEMKVNLIMTDYSMPGMTGYELLKKIKESKAFKEVPVVIMSSENILTRIDRCLEEGAEDFIVKPVKLEDVRRLKDSVMKGDSVENGTQKRKLEDDDEEDHTSSSQPCSPSPSPPMKVQPIVALTTASLLSPSPLMKRPRLCNVE